MKLHSVLKVVNERVAAGEEPAGAYRWVDLHEVDGERAVPVPAEWFDGDRDRRFAFHESGGYDLSSQRA